MLKSNRPLRILQVYGWLQRGGAETWLMDVMRNTSRDEFQIDVCITVGVNIKGPYEAEFESLGGKILRCQKDKKNIWFFPRRFKKILRAGSYDVVHCHLHYFSGLVLRLAAQAGVPKRVAHSHPAEDLKAGRLLYDLYAWWMKRWVQRYGTDFTAPSKASLEAFWGPGWKDDPRKHVIHNGICTDRFLQPADRAKVRRQLGIPENAPIVLNVSNFRPHKRHEFLVQVAQRLLAQRPDVYFLLIGAGRRKEVIEELVYTKGLGKNFRFISGAPNIDNYWMAADVFAFPSCNEGFGIVVIEAAAAGLRVIAQDIPGVREAATTCPDLILLPLKTTAEQWAQRLLGALKQPRMPEGQRQMLLKQFPFTIENSVKKLREVYGN
ncbi:MAG: glycosyltransferase [Planctomycetota bacterium]|jgi:glycosyltransferase involved in cell wall biosynthesis